jgi:hypothetical protein
MGHNKQSRFSVGRPYSIKAVFDSKPNQNSGTIITAQLMRRDEAPILQQIYRLQPDSVGDKKGEICANHSTIASDDAARIPYQYC